MFSVHLLRISKSFAGLLKLTEIVENTRVSLAAQSLKHMQIRRNDMQVRHHDWHVLCSLYHTLLFMVEYALN